MEIEKYLKRINCEHLREPSIENLKLLQENHLRNIPFENLDVALKRFIKSDLETVYEKVINKSRGGFCFELNHLFHWLLKQLGYKVDLVSCRIYQASSKTYMNWLTHAVNLATINNCSYLIDVGFSSPYKHPLTFEVNKIQSDMNGFMKIENADEEYCFTVSRCNSILEDTSLNDNSNWSPIYDVDIRPRKIEDFQAMLKWVQTEENPRFYNRTFFIRLIDNGIMMLIGFKFTKMFFKDSILIEREDKILNKTEVMQAVKNDFFVILETDFEPKDM